MSSQYTSAYIGMGSLPHCIIIEEAAQREIAESEKWYLARELYSINEEVVQMDSRRCLGDLGIKVIRNIGLFYETSAPFGWSKTTDRYWTTIVDAEGSTIIKQFYKGSPHDERAFLKIFDSEDD